MSSAWRSVAYTCGGFTVTSALDHLASLPVYVINPDSFTERLEQFTRETAPLFKEVRRVSAVDGTGGHQRERAEEWLAMIRSSYEKDALERQLFTQIRDYRGTVVPYLVHTYSCAYALYESVMMALQLGIESGDDRFVICEDDAVPRRQVLAEEDASDADIAVWGGMLRMGAYNTDTAAFLAGRQSRWCEITSSKNHYIATTYEVTSRAAERLLEDMDRFPMPADISWWYTAMRDDVKMTSLRPMGFVQHGLQIRRYKNRNQQGVTER